MNTKRVIILGGGFAGVGVAKRLLKLRNKNDNWDIVLIDKNTYQTYTPSLYEVATGYGSADKHFSETAGSVVGIPYQAMFNGENIMMIYDAVAKIDIANKEITTQKGSVLRFDYCVVGLGTETNYFDVSGAEKYSYALKSFYDAVRLHQKLHSLVDTATVAKKHIVVVGGGFSGVEIAAELSCCLDHLCKDCNISPQTVTVTIVEGSDTLLPGIHKRILYAVEKRLHRLGVRAITGSRVTSVSEHHVLLDSGEKLSADLTIWATGVRVPKIVADIAGLEHGKRGRIAVDDYLRAKGNEHIFALGDNALYTDRETNKPALGTASIAIRQAPVVADNIAAALAKKPLTPYVMKFPGFVVPVGGKFVVAQIGRFVFGGFFARVLHQIIAWKYYISVLPFSRASRMMIRGSRLFSQND